MSDAQTPPGAETAREAPPPADNAARSVRRGTLMVLAVLAATLTWYLLADRYTPYTSQARVQGFVVGVAPKVSGLIVEVWVRNDQEVRRGERLFRIDPEAYEIALRQARTQLEAARSELAVAESTVDVARAKVEAAQANLKMAAQDAQRQEALRRKDPGAISMRRLEIARAQLSVAQANVTAALADLQKAQEQKQAAAEKVQSARHAVEQAELDLRNTLVVAPSRGVITDLRADVGKYASAGQAVMTLVAIHDVWISAAFTENNLGHMAKGDPVEILLDVLPGEVFEGRVRSIGLGVAAGQAPPAGTLPTIQNVRDWLRQAQRFPVSVEFAPEVRERLRSVLRVGGQADVIAYTGSAWAPLRWLGALYIRMMAWFSYLY
jgi:multidrug resistance efflux pump